MQKLQTQGVHHITLVGADRQTSIDFWEGVLGMPFVFEQPNLDVPEESHLYFDPGDGRLITVFTNETRKPDPTPNPTEIGSVHHIAFSVSHATFPQAVARLDERGISQQRSEGPRLHGFDLLPRSARPPLRARLLPLRAAGRHHPCRGAAGGASASASRAATTISPKCISPTPSRCSSSAARQTCRTTARRRTPTEPICAGAARFFEKLLGRFCRIRQIARSPGGRRSIAFYLGPTYG